MIDQARIPLRFRVPPEEQHRQDTFSLKETEIFCAVCPRVAEIQAALRPMSCFLQRETKKTGQAYFEGSYGVTVQFLAGHLAVPDEAGTAPMPHVARFWVSGNTHPRSLELQQQILRKLVALTIGTVVEASPLPLSKGA